MKTTVLNSEQIKQKIIRLAYQVYENNYTEKEIVLAGITGRGYLLAQKIGEELSKIADTKLLIGEVMLNKDDPLSHPIEFSIAESELKNKVIFLVDDVINSGKTLIYAVKHFLKVPVKKLRTVVLVDRSHNIYPIKADFVGISLSTSLLEHVSVQFSKGKDKVILE